MSEIAKSSAAIRSELLKSQQFIGLLLNGAKNPNHALFGADHSDIANLAEESDKSATLFSDVAEHRNDFTSSI